MDLQAYVEQEDALFHYTTVPVGIEHVLSTRRLRLSKFGDFKDPYEYGFTILSSHSSGPMKYNQETMQAINNLRRKSCKVFCFCSNKKPTVVLKTGESETFSLSSGWQRSRMWSQYGDGHKGICLIFSKDIIQEYLRGLSQCVEIQQSDYVTYFEEFEGFPEFETANSLQNVEAYALTYIKNNYSLLFRKHIDYRDEAEFRVVILDPQDNVPDIDVTSILKGIIVGDRTPDVYTPLIKQLGHNLNVEVLKARWIPGTPKWVLKDC